MAVAIDTTPLTPEQRLYLPLLMETAFKLPCAADGAAAALSKDDFVAALQADTVRYACDTGGIRGGSSQLLTFFVQVELDGGNGLAVALKWIRRALYLTQARARRPVRVHVHVHVHVHAHDMHACLCSACLWLTMHMHMPCYAMHMPCICRAYAVHMPCICHAYAVQLTPELLGIAVKRELSQIPAAVRNGSGIVSALSWLTNYTDADNDLNGAPLYRHPAHLLGLGLGLWAERKHRRAHGSPLALHKCTHVSCSCVCVHPSRQATPSASSPSSRISRHSCSPRSRAAPPPSPRSPRCAPCCSSRTA